MRPGAFLKGGHLFSRPRCASVEVSAALSLRALAREKSAPPIVRILFGVGMRVGVLVPYETKPRNIMKNVKKATNGELREWRLKEYFFNAYLIEMLKRVGEETGKIRRRGQAGMKPVAVKMREFFELGDLTQGRR